MSSPCELHEGRLGDLCRDGATSLKDTVDVLGSDDHQGGSPNFFETLARGWIKLDMLTPIIDLTDRERPLDHLLPQPFGRGAFGTAGSVQVCPGDNPADLAVVTVTDRFLMGTAKVFKEGVAGVVQAGRRNTYEDDLVYAVRMFDSEVERDCTSQ